MSKITGVIAGFGWLGFSIVLITLFGFMSLVSILFNGFRDSIWAAYNIPATVAIFLFPMMLIMIGLLFYYGIKSFWLLLDAGYWWLQISLSEWLNPNGIIEGEVVDVVE